VFFSEHIVLNGVITHREQPK